jgi:cytochrome c-type biogenesis protein CcmE
MNKSSSNKIIIAVIPIMAIVACSSLQTTAQYFLTVDEVLSQKSKFMERNIRISGVVLGDTIEYDESSQALSFTIANIPADYQTVEGLGGLERVLHESANDPNSSTIKVVFVGPKPELLQAEAQAILTGRLGDDGIFYAQEILLRCPTRYEESLPEQVE